MKKNLLLLVLALIGMGGFTACNNEDELLVQEQANAKPVVIRATIGNVSRLALGDSDGTSTKVTWSTGDAFALKIGEQTYTFNWQEGNDFVYANDNFPETFATAGTITATYPATAAGELSVQSGTRANVGNYMQMTASKEVTAGQPTTNLNLSFEHQTSVVEIALEKSELASQSVVVDLRTIAESMYSTPADGEGVLSFDSDGKLTVYFAVSPTDATIKDWHIGVKDIDGNDYYTATLSEMKLAASKMYKVSKDALTPSYLVSDDGKTVTAHNAIGLYKWAEMATEDPTNNVVNLELGDDITLPTEGIGEDSDGPVTGNWTPVGNLTTPYKGNIDGNDKKISNMYIVNKTNTANYQGFIGYSGKVTIKDLKFDGAKIVVGDKDDTSGVGGGGYVGVISGASKANFDNCHVTNSKLKCLGLGTASHTMGGLVGTLSPSSGFGKITDSSFNGTIDGRSYVGGIVGELIAAIGFNSYFASVTNCTAEGTIEGIDLVGGIAGWSRGYIEECTNEATVMGEASGGIVGQMAAYACTIGCTNEGEIVGSGDDGTGGIVGLIKADDVGNETKTYVIACRNLNAKVTLTGTQRSGGIVGNQDRQLSGVYGSYTIKSDEANAFQSWFGQNPNSATNGTNNVFDSATGTDLPESAVTALNTSIETAFSSDMYSTQQSLYVSKGNYEIYGGYRWPWTPGSWPVLEYAD